MTFEEFAAERLPGVLRFAAILTGDRALAEDLAQEVLIRAHSRWSKIGSLDRPEYYVRKMILNEFLHWRRREWRLIPSGAGSDVDDRTAPDHAVGYAERDDLFARLGKLPGRAPRNRPGADRLVGPEPAATTLQGSSPEAREVQVQAVREKDIWHIGVRAAEGVTRHGGTSGWRGRRFRCPRTGPAI